MVMSFTEGRENRFGNDVGVKVTHVMLGYPEMPLRYPWGRCLVGSWIYRSGIGRWFRLETNI